MKTLRFGCIGCGLIAPLHVLNARYVPGMEVVAFADVDKARADSFLARYGGRYATEDPGRIFADPEIDAVLIQAGERHHPALGIAAAKAGKHIFMEKPIADTVENALKLERAVREAKIKFLTGLCNRLGPNVQRAKKMLPHPWITFGQGADRLIGGACHNLDLIVHLFHDAPLISVYASGGQYYGLDPEIAADSFVAILRFEDGSQASYIQHGLAYNALMGKFSFQLFGKDRCVFLAKRFKECHLSTTLAAPDISTIFPVPDFNDPPPEKHETNTRGPHGYMGHYEELVALCQAIRHDTEPPMTVEEGRHVLQVEKAILQSIVTRQIIDYPRYLSQWKTTQPRRATAG